MSGDLLSVKIKKPIFSDYINLDTFLLEKDDTVSSPVVQNLDFDICYFSSDDNDDDDVDYQIVGNISGYIIDVEELTRSFKERDHIYIFDFENLGQHVSDIYTYLYENPSEDEKYKKIYLIENLTLINEYDKSFIYQPIYKVVTNTIKHILNKDISHICEFISNSLFISYKNK
jgi:hypothetical protein